MSRKPDFSCPDHPALGEVVVVNKYCKDRAGVFVTCPEPGCQVRRVLLLSNVRQDIKRGVFTGRCDMHRIRQRRHGRRKLRNGFIQLYELAVPLQHRPTFWALSVRNNKPVPVLEHDFLMTIMIGRPMFPNERVRHRDRMPWNNDPDNLEMTVTAGGNLFVSPAPHTYVEKAREAYAMIASGHA